MALILVITQGPRNGDRFKLKPGTVLGRSKADINLRDPKVSNKHAVVKEIDGDIVLVDSGSTNGIKIGGKKVPQLILKAGQKFILGTTHVEIVQESDVGEEDPNLEEWRRSVLRTVSKVGGFMATAVPLIRAFHRPVELQFREGQNSQSRIFAYGPRTIDPFSLDLDIDVPVLPSIFFQLIPEGERTIRYKTPHPEFVRLNGQHVETEELKDGDVIEIQDVELKVVLR
ncbi:MAG: FHA domain-containing protein [Bdellovibrionia bacterium]